MEISSSQKFFYDHMANRPLVKCRLSKAERTRRSREMFWRKGSKVLPDFFPPAFGTQPNKSVNQDTILLTSVVKQYSWEEEEQCEAQRIAESWMTYFGPEPSDFTKVLCLRKINMTAQFLLILDLFSSKHCQEGKGRE